MAGADTVASTTGATSSPTRRPRPRRPHADQDPHAHPDPPPPRSPSGPASCIGTNGSYQKQGNTISKADDGNLNTYFDGPDAAHDWVGVKLSAAQKVTTIKFAPRAGYASRMVGGIFQASNSANVQLNGAANLYTVTKAPTAGTLTTVTLSKAVTYQYYRYLVPGHRPRQRRRRPVPGVNPQEPVLTETPAAIVSKSDLASE